MRELSPGLRRIVERGRTGLAPSEIDRERMRRRVLVATGLAASAAAPAAATAASAAASATTGGVTVAGATTAVISTTAAATTTVATGGVVAKVVVAKVVLGALAAAGVVGGGYSTARSTARRATVPTPTITAPAITGPVEDTRIRAGARDLASPPSGPHRDVVAEGAPELAAAPPAVAAIGADEPSPRPTAHRGGRRAARTPSPATAVAPNGGDDAPAAQADSPGATAPDATTPDSLSAELALLGEARAANARCEWTRALSVLARFDREHPHGQLAQEAWFLRAVVSCRAGDVAAAGATSRRFRQRWPRSPLATRVARVCEGLRSQEECRVSE